MWKPSWLVKHTVPVNSPDTFNSSDGQIEMGVKVLTTKLPSWQPRPQNCVCCMMPLHQSVKCLIVCCYGRCTSTKNEIAEMSSTAAQ